MPTVLERLARRQHAAVAALSAWLILTSPWISMVGRVPRNAGVLEYSHVVLGLLVAPLAITYLLDCVRAGRWQLYFPWLAGQLGPAARDLAGLLRGRVPVAEGGGLFALIEGLTLLMLVATAWTGVAWFATQGSSDALAWRGYHVVAARGLMALVVVHAVTVSMHLLDFVRE
jgi:hypothetical protein